MCQRVLNTLLERSSHRAHELGAEVAANSISAQWQGQAGHVAPPLAAVEDLLQAGFPVRELTLVDDQAGFVFSVEDSGNDLVERDYLGLHVRRPEFQRKIGGGQLARYRDDL